MTSRPGPGPGVAGGGEEDFREVQGDETKRINGETVLVSREGRVFRPSDDNDFSDWGVVLAHNIHRIMELTTTMNRAVVIRIG